LHVARKHRPDIGRAYENRSALANLRLLVPRAEHVLDADETASLEEADQEANGIQLVRTGHERRPDGEYAP
jgi:hypothetical protein